VLQRVAVCCSALQGTGIWIIRDLGVATVRCSVLQYLLQCVAVFVAVLQCVKMGQEDTPKHLLSEQQIHALFG